MDAAADYRALLAADPEVVTVTFGSFTALGILVFQGQALGPEGLARIDGESITLCFCTPDLPGLQPGSAITAGGAPYSITRGPYRRGDGVESIAELEETS